MARARKPRVVLTAEQKKKQRQLRRELRKQAAIDNPSVAVAMRPDRTPHQENQFWLSTKDRMAAMKIINDHRERPYWLSIPRGTGTPPVAGYFPCSMFSRGGRWYYGFLFREHRDRAFKQWAYARKELTQ